MTSPETPTNTSSRTPVTTPARQQRMGSGTASPRARDAQLPIDSRRSSTWLGWVGIAAALVAAIWLALAGVAVDQAPVPSAAANEAATARLQAAADQYEAVRTARANQAATARLQGLADQHEAIRITRANQAATARLQGLADRRNPAP